MTLDSAEMFRTPASSSLSLLNSSMSPIIATNLSQRKRILATPKSQALVCNGAMRRPKESSWILAQNLKKILGEQSARSWAGPQDNKKNQALARNVSRIIKGTTSTKGSSPSVDLLDRIAERCGNLQAWHLLLPNLDPKNPPVLTMTATERDLYRRMKQSVLDLPDQP